MPYVLWNVIFVLWYAALECLPLTARYVNSAGLARHYVEVPVWQAVWDLLAGPAAFQLWFLRDLLCMMFIAPALWWLSRRAWWLAAAVAIGSVAAYPWLIFFATGIILGARRVDVEHYWRPAWAVATAAAVFAGYGVCKGMDIALPSAAETAIHLVMLYAVWALYDVLARGRCPAQTGVWGWVCGYSFFIYCAHEPAFNIIKKLALALFGQSEAVLITFYYLNPLLLVACLVVVAKGLQRLTPRAYRVLTGGR